MAKHHLKNAELEVRRVLDGPVRMNTAYGPIVIPTGHFIITFPGDFELGTALSPDVFGEMFDLSDDDRAEWGLDAEPNPGEQPTKFVDTATGEAVIGVAGDFPPSRPDTMPQVPPLGVGPGATTPIGVNPPTDAQVNEWVDAHYAEQYRDRVSERLRGNPTRAAQLLDRYPVASPAQNDIPSPDAVTAGGPLADDAARAEEAQRQTPLAEGAAVPAPASAEAEPLPIGEMATAEPAPPEGFPEPQSPDVIVPELRPDEPAQGEPRAGEPTS